MRRAAASLALLSGVVFFFVAPGPAFASTATCPSDACTPQFVGMAAELSGTMTPAESAAMAQIANLNTIGSGVTPAVGSGLPVGVATTTAAGGFSWTSVLQAGFPLLGLTPLLLGGLGASDLTLPNDLSGLPPAVSSGTAIGRYNSPSAPLTTAAPAWTVDASNRMTGYSSRPSGTTVDLYRTPAAQPSMQAQDAYNCWAGGSCLVGSVNWSFVGSYSGGFADFPVDYANWKYYAKVVGTGFAFFANPAPFTNPNPPRWVEQTVTCKRADGTSHSITMQTTPAEAVAGAVIHVLGILCPTGEKATSATSTLKATGATDVGLGGQTWPDTSSIPSACASGSVNVCGVRLQWNDGTETSPNWRTCPTGVTSVCTGWKEAPDKRTRYRCQFGTGTTWAVVALSSCSPIPTDPDPEPPPWTNEDTPETFCEIGLADILTGFVVFKAVGCAIKWAFVPQTPWAEIAAPVTTAVDGSVVGEASTVADAWVGPFTDLATQSSGDCLGPPITVNNPAPGGGRPSVLIDNVHPWSACGPVAAQVSAVWIPLASFVTLFSALYIGVNSLLRTVGASASFADDAQSFGAREASRRGD